MGKPLSYSGIGTYEKCPRKFKYHYIDKLEMEKGPVPPHLIRGLKLHGQIEDYLNGKLEVREMDPDLMKHMRYIDNLKHQGAIAELKFCVANDWSMQDWDAEEGLLRGIQDVVLVWDDTGYAESIDWKTGKVYAEHCDQRALYALFIFLAYPHVETVRSSSYYLDQNISKNNNYERNKLTSYKWVWEKKANKTRPPQPYPARKGYWCNYCEYGKSKGGPCPNG